MGYKKKYNPFDYEDIREILDSMLELGTGYQFKILLDPSEIRRMQYRILQFISQTKQRGYCVSRKEDGLVIARKGKVNFELCKPEPISLDGTDEVGSEEPQESGL